jgi:beta-lactamase superfamily II metal-dependent hydrolase
MVWRRRDLLTAAGAGLLASHTTAWAQAPGEALEDAPGRPLSPWRPGGLDIHHIATNRGDSTLVVAPDGRGLMIDAGASATPTPDALDIRPSGARRAGEWIGRYARRHLAATGRIALDALLVSHLHPDHLGDFGVGVPSPDGAYRLTGVSDVAALLPIGLIVDRAWPDYSWPQPQTAPFAANYIAFIRHRAAAGGRVETFRVGAANQLLPSGQVEIRNIAANGEVWSGQGEGARRLFPDIKTLPPGDIPDENACSAAIRLRYGAFSYFAGGDLTSNSYDGVLPWRNVLAPAARAAGPVSVSTAPHHGMFDGLDGDAVRALRPRVWVISGWHSVHPNMEAMERMLSQRLYAGPRDVLTTGISPANIQVNRRLTDRLASTTGHIVVRVAPGGASYRIVVTDNADEADTVRRVLGPYPSA